MSTAEDRQALDAELLSWMREPDWKFEEARFAALALDLFAHQFAHCPPYRRFAEGRGLTPASVEHWRQVPAVPAGAFKELALRSFPEANTVKTFRTSGTSGQKQGELIRFVCIWPVSGVLYLLTSNTVGVRRYNSLT